MKVCPPPSRFEPDEDGEAEETGPSGSRLSSSRGRGFGTKAKREGPGGAESTRRRRGRGPRRKRNRGRDLGSAQNVGEERVRPVTPAGEPHVPSYEGESESETEGWRGVERGKEWERLLLSPTTSHCVPLAPSLVLVGSPLLPPPVLPRSPTRPRTKRPAPVLLTLGSSKARKTPIDPWQRRHITRSLPRPHPFGLSCIFPLFLLARFVEGPTSSSLRNRRRRPPPPPVTRFACARPPSATPPPYSSPAYALSLSLSLPGADDSHNPRLFPLHFRRPPSLPST